MWRRELLDQSLGWYCGCTFWLGFLILGLAVAVLLLWFKSMGY